MNNQLSIQDIDKKIALFKDALTQSFVPADEKSLAQDAITRLEAQKRQMEASASNAQQPAITNSTSWFATQLQDTESQPGDDKKKSLPRLLALWENLPFVKKVSGLIKVLAKLRFRFRL